MVKKIVWLLSSTLLITALLLSGCQQQAKKDLEQPKEQAQKAVDETQRKAKDVVDTRTMATWTKEDKFKNGCVDCHKKTEQQDASLNAQAAKIKNHPPVPADATTKTCLDCHRRSPENRTKLSNRLHKSHAASMFFRPKYGGSCVSCHGMQDTGQIVIKGE